MAIGILYAMYRPDVSLGGAQYLLFDVGGLVATVGMLGALVASTVRNTMTLYRAEPIPVVEERR